ncbi:Cytochrome P450 CYP12A2 [Atta colombica]|uniref:Cytochrome P450 CYP12A2 n=1 Tax=Atta colombica TaxID=520822 RepID=A0A195B0V5_9HYME|nr:Cytochrome P450 CYP12A2 [Atta colombica]
MLVSLSIAKGSNKAQDVVATYNQSNVRTISMGAFHLMTQINTKRRFILLLPECQERQNDTRTDLFQRVYREPHRPNTEAYINCVRCNISSLGEKGALSQGKLWHDFRSKVNPHMMQSRMIKAHVSQISEVASEFIEKMRARNYMELPSVFTNELLKWILESICSIALDVALECLIPNLAAASEPRIMINCMHEMFDLMYCMEIQMSLWKIYNTRNLKKFFHVLDTLNGKLKYETMNNSTNLHECSILEKLLHIDKITAQVMALDILMTNILNNNLLQTGNLSGSLYYIALYYIANNSEENLREEVMSVLLDKTLPITQNVLNQKRYAKACIKESLRLFLIAVAILRTMQMDVC